MSQTKTYIKKPETIKATQWFKVGDHHQVKQMDQPFVPFNVKQCRACGRHSSDHGQITTLEDSNLVCPGDYIIRAGKDEYKVMKREDFESTYEELK